jgi:hypothetical protein
MRDYLLGYLDETAMATFEDRMVGDPDVLDQLEATLDDLDDDYVGRRLSADDQRRYEERYLHTAAGRARVTFAQALKDHREATAPVVPIGTGASFFRGLRGLIGNQRPALQLALAAVLLLLVSGPPVAVIRFNQLTRRIDGLQTDLKAEADRARAAAEAVDQERRLRTAAEEQLADLSVASFDLFPGSRRGEGPLAIGSGADVVRFRLALEQPLPARVVRAELVTATGAIAWRAALDSGAIHDPATPVVAIPGAILTPGEYQLRLTAQGSHGTTEELAQYAFRIAHR